MRSVTFNAEKHFYLGALKSQSIKLKTLKKNLKFNCQTLNRFRAKISSRAVAIKKDQTL